MSETSRNRAKPPHTRPPLDATALRDLALHYAGRFATTQTKLGDYLARKLRERGWNDEAPADIPALCARLADLGYVNDAAYAGMKSQSLTRRGYGPRRIGEALRAAGVGEEDAQDARDAASDQRWRAAETLARRKRIGPYALSPADRPLREKHLAAFLRAGHDMATARAWVEAMPGEVLEEGD